MINIIKKTRLFQRYTSNIIIKRNRYNNEILHNGICTFLVKYNFNPFSSYNRYSNRWYTTDSSSIKNRLGFPGIQTNVQKFTMIYTCSICETRSGKVISKHAYTKGVVLVRCPGCENLHLIADHLGWFDEKSVDIESILKDKGEKVKKITNDNVIELTNADIIGNDTIETNRLKFNKTK